MKVKQFIGNLVNGITIEGQLISGKTFARSEKNMNTHYNNIVVDEIVRAGHNDLPRLEK